MFAVCDFMLREIYGVETESGHKKTNDHSIPVNTGCPPQNRRAAIRLVAGCVEGSGARSGRIVPAAGLAAGHGACSPKVRAAVSALCATGICGPHAAG